jgi:hypothetical protein
MNTRILAPRLFCAALCLALYACASVPNQHADGNTKPARATPLADRDLFLNDRMFASQPPVSSYLPPGDVGRNNPGNPPYPW